MEQAATFTPNEDKQLSIETKNGPYLRFPVKTDVVKDGDDLYALLQKFVLAHVQPDDMIFMSEKIVAISQGRAFHIDDIKPSRLAKFLMKFVYKSPYGIGLGSPWTMELAVREVGRFKICCVALIAGIAKIFGKRGVFYDILGPKVAAIDGPCDYTLPPYNQYAKMAPLNPDKVATDLKSLTGHEIIIIDANDLNVDILGKSSKELDNEFLAAIFKDNPLGQSCEQTPIAIVRKDTAAGNADTIPGGTADAETIEYTAPTTSEQPLPGDDLPPIPVAE